MNTPDLDRIAQLAARFPAPQYREDIAQDVWERVHHGADYDSAYRAAAAPYHTYLRHMRGEVSLDALTAVLGDALTVQPIDAPALSASARHTADHRAGRKATPHAAKIGMGVLAQFDDINELLTVLRNLQDRGVVSIGNPFTFALDVMRLDDDLRRAVIAQLCLFTRQERRGAGLGRQGERWLERHAAYRLDLA